MNKRSIIVRLEALEAGAERHGQLVACPEIQQALELAYGIEAEPIALPMAVAETLEARLLAAWGA